MEPYFLDIVHEMGGDGLKAEEEHGKANIDDNSGHNLEEGSNSIDCTLIFYWWKPSEANFADSVIDSFAVGVGGGE